MDLQPRGHFPINLKISETLPILIEAGDDTLGLCVSYPATGTVTEGEVCSRDTLAALSLLHFSHKLAQANLNMRAYALSF